MENNIETRTFDTEIKIESESIVDEIGNRTPEIRRIVGLGAVFNKRSEDLGFIEVIHPGAFKNAIKTSDARALYNHDSNQLPLGRQSSGTLRLSETSKGLKYEIDPPDTQLARDLQISIDRGDINQSSFAFSVEEDKWERIDGADVRTILSVREIFDVSPVVYPAYTDTTVAVRSRDKWKSEQEQHFPNESVGDDSSVNAARTEEIQRKTLITQAIMSEVF